MIDSLDHEKHMETALAAARYALDSGEFPVGCALVHENQVVSSGARKNSREGGNELDHAEIVALRGLYSALPVYDLSEVVVYSTMEPCLMCFSTLILNGIRTVVYGYEDAMGGGSRVDLARLAPLYSSMKIEVIPGILRSECLKLFQQFFQDDENDYWKDSLLAQYTAEQGNN